MTRADGFAVCVALPASQEEETPLILITKFNVTFDDHYRNSLFHALNVTDHFLCSKFGLYNYQNHLRRNVVTTKTLGRLWISALPLVVFFAVPTVANAQTRIGTANHFGTFSGCRIGPGAERPGVRRFRIRTLRLWLRSLWLWLRTLWLRLRFRLRLPALV